MAATAPALLHKEGNLLFGKGQWSAAACKYQAALDAINEQRCEADDSNDTGALVVRCTGNLAACALQEGNNDEALRLCDRVLSLEPQHPKNRFRRASALLRRRHAGPNEQASLLPPASQSSARDLLQAQEDLEIASQGSPSDKAILKAQEDLHATSQAIGVRLKPSRRAFLTGLLDFEYLHCQASEASSSSAALAGSTLQGSPRTICSSGGSEPGLERNLLILLHGFGGRKEPFAALARQLNLPKTACLAINGPQALPDELLDDPPGFSWFTMLDDETMDFIQPSPKEQRRLFSLEASARQLDEVIHTLITRYGWSRNEIFLLGYGQGGTLALEVLERSCHHQEPLGGSISVAGHILPEKLGVEVARALPATRGSEVPAALLINGALDRQTSVSMAEASARRLREVLGNSSVQLRIFSDRGGEMLRGSHAEESMCVMQFLSDRLHGVGRRGSQEAMQKLGAEEVVFAEELPPGASCSDHDVEEAKPEAASLSNVLSEMD